MVDTIDRYVRGGARAISVLTDTQFLVEAWLISHLRASCGLPIIRKDFIISTYQIDEAKAYGADFILLVLRFYLARFKSLTYAHEIGLEVLQKYTIKKNY